MGGGFGEKRANLVLNRATNIQRQPGSSSKPLNVYAPGIEMNKITGATIITDEMVYLDPDNPDTPYPRNAYYPEYRGDMTVHQKLPSSYLKTLINLQVVYLVQLLQVLNCLDLV